MSQLGRAATRRRAGLAALALTAAAALLAPALAPLGGAWAEEPAERPEWAPPPPAGPPPEDGDGQPDQDYEQTQECVTRAGELGEEITLRNIPWGQMHLRVDDVHEHMRRNVGSIGGDITVAVIDTGVTPHPFFGERIDGGGDYVMGEDGLEDCDGHGTQVAGIIAGDPDATGDAAEVGFSGLAPDARILSIRQSSQNYSPEADDGPELGDADDGDLPEDLDLEDLDLDDLDFDDLDLDDLDPDDLPEGFDLEDLEDLDPDAGDPDSDENGEAPEGPGTDGAAAGQADPEAAGTTPGQQGDPRVIDTEEGAGNLTTLAQALRRAADADGVEVVNMSVEHCRPAGGEITPAEAELQSAVRYAVDADVVVVAAAGNISDACPQNEDPTGEPNTLVSPAWFSEDLLAVSAIDRAGDVAPFSVHGPWVSVAAPGAEIISLDPVAGSTQLANLTVEGGEEVELQGTSFAAPYVSGLAVLVRQMFPELDAHEVMHRIEATAQHPGAPDGRDQFVGHGVINPMAALTATVPGQGVEPAGDLAVPSDMPAAGPDDSTPVIVALAGSGGALAALGLTFFVVHTVRRNRR